MGRSHGASFKFVTGNLVEESNGVPFEFFNGVNYNYFLLFSENSCKIVSTIFLPS
jgi:hypothetical protein